jgi:imidazolonepropionase
MVDGCNMSTLWKNARLATLQGATGWGLIDSGALLVSGGIIQWVGPMADLPADTKPAHTIDCHHALLTPGFVDAHTHLVYGGSRANEFEMRLQGASYEEIAKSGGGIVSTVAATRGASEQALFASARLRAITLMQRGVTTLEIKSGYGLSEEHEARCLRVARRLGEELPISIRTTCLAAHALPPEYAQRPDEYISAVCQWLTTLKAENLIDAVDVFCERIGFTRAQTQRVFEAAKALQLPIKLHAEQLSDQGGAQLAAQFGALSCDHLEYLSDDGIAAMAGSGTVAILLPGAFYFLRETKLPPVQALRDAGVPIAIATDHNPGSSPTLSPLLIMSMACTFFRLTPDEALRGFTINAAKALGLHDRGCLKPKQRADFVIWPPDINHPNQLAYEFGLDPKIQVVIDGQAL